MGKPGLVLRGPFHYTSHMDFIDRDPVQYDEHSTGTYGNLHLPAGGTVFHEAGQWSPVIEWPEGWDHTEPYDGHGNFGSDPDALCAALTD